MQTNDRDLRHVFEKFGKVTDVFVPQERGTGRSRYACLFDRIDSSFAQFSCCSGFAFVTFEDERDADEAVDEMDGSKLYF